MAIKAKHGRYIAIFCSLALLLCSTVACRPEPPAIFLFGATPSEIDLGQSTKLKWAVKGATGVNIDQGIGEVSATGLMELSPAKTIAYTLTATNAGGTVSKSAVIYVNPPPAPPGDTAPPVIGNVSTSSETDTSAVITWTTDEPSSSQVDYGTTIEYGLTATSDELTIAHSVTLSGLEPNAAYYYRVNSKDEAGNEASSTNNTLFTLQEGSSYSLELLSLEWGRRAEETYGLGEPIAGSEHLFIKGSLRNTSNATLRAVLCTMKCWNGDTLVKYEVYVYHGPALPGYVFDFDIQTADDPTVDNVTVDFADSEGREIKAIEK
ncbi:fibronectin type III domain-containing protein [Chloroflexota bacterium]